MTAIQTMTFEQFQATGRDCDDLNKMNGVTEEGVRGRVYLDYLYLEDTTTWPEKQAGQPRWYAMLCQEEHSSDNIADVELALYVWAVEEEMIAEPVRVEPTPLTDEQLDRARIDSPNDGPTPQSIAARQAPAVEPTPQSIAARNDDGAFARLFLAYHDNKTPDEVTIETLEQAARRVVANESPAVESILKKQAGFAVVTFQTAKARRVVPSRMPSSRELELGEYYSPAGEIKIVASSDEIEDFEREAQATIDADIIDDAETFADLFRYLTENCKLRASL